MIFKDINPGTEFVSPGKYIAVKLAAPTNLTRTHGGYRLNGSCVRCGMKSPYQNAVINDGTERTIHICDSDIVIV